MSCCGFGLELHEDKRVRALAHPMQESGKSKMRIGLERKVANFKLSNYSQEQTMDFFCNRSSHCIRMKPLFRLFVAMSKRFLKLIDH